jgi:secreted trypsin-like serine protease
MNAAMKVLLIVVIEIIMSSFIVMRHDVDESEYLILGEKYGESFVKLNAGCGTFIAPNWIITAAHVASNSRVGNDVTVNGVTYDFKRKIIHPDFEITEEGVVLHDIALIELERKVPDIAIAKLYRKTDELGKEIIFVGTGWASTGDVGMHEGKINKDRKKRAAQNKVDGIKSGYLQFTFDPPSSEEALPLEGISGPGDSGGPALFIKNQLTYIVGVSSHQDYGDQEVEGLYGSLEYYTRVSDYIDWLEKSLKSN